MSQMLMAGPTAMCSDHGLTAWMSHAGGPGFGSSILVLTFRWKKLRVTKRHSRSCKAVRKVSARIISARYIDRSGGFMPSHDPPTTCFETFPFPEATAEQKSAGMDDDT